MFVPTTRAFHPRRPEPVAHDGPSQPCLYFLKILLSRPASVHGHRCGEVRLRKRPRRGLPRHGEARDVPPAGVRAGRDQGGRRVRPGGHGRGRVRAGHLTIFPQFSWYIFEFGAVPFSSSGGRLPAALFMVFLLDSKGAKVCKSCRSRQELSNEYLLSKFGVVTAENGPLKVCQTLAESCKTLEKT